MRLVLLLIVLATAPCVQASSFAGSSAGTTAGGASNTSGSTSGDDKIVRDAREDAAVFVASDGQLRGPRLAAALRVLRERDEAARRASDLDLARALLAH